MDYGDRFLSELSMDQRGRDGMSHVRTSIRICEDMVSLPLAWRR